LKKVNECDTLSLAVPSLPPSGWAQLLKEHISFLYNVVIIFIDEMNLGQLKD
jgi:hypothetical protein